MDKQYKYTYLKYYSERDIFFDFVAENVGDYGR